MKIELFLLQTEQNICKDWILSIEKMGETKRDRDVNYNKIDRQRDGQTNSQASSVRERVCVCERKRERERERG